MKTRKGSRPVEMEAPLGLDPSAKLTILGADDDEDDDEDDEDDDEDDHEDDRDSSEDDSDSSSDDV